MIRGGQSERRHQVPLSAEACLLDECRPGAIGVPQRLPQVRIGDDIGRVFRYVSGVVGVRDAGGAELAVLVRSVPVPEREQGRGGEVPDSRWRRRVVRRYAQASNIAVCTMASARATIGGPSVPAETAASAV